MKFGGTLLIIGTLIIGGTVAEARILGAGPKKSDCFMYFDGVDATKGKTTVECQDNQPCDFDTVGGQCTFRFTVCTGATDVQGCTPADVTQFKGGGLNKLNIPPVGPGSCAAPSDYVITLKRSKPTNKRAFKLSAITATGTPKRDLDTLILKCIASPSGAFVYE